MESTKEPVRQKLKVNHIVYTKVEDIKPNGDSWWVHFEGSHESMNFNGEKPFEIGNTVKITFERIEDALPSQPPV